MYACYNRPQLQSVVHSVAYVRISQAHGVLVGRSDFYGFAKQAAPASPEFIGLQGRIFKTRYNGLIEAW